MYHRIRWTPEKIKLQLQTITPLVYIKRKSLSSFQYHELESALVPPPIGIMINDSDWQEIDAHEYWGSWMQNFVLRTIFTIPEDWDKSQPIALYLPLGEAGDISHPEALAYIDDEPYVACDRHHQEILLNPKWADGKSHLLALHGWTGLGGFAKSAAFRKLYMRQCALIQIHQPTRDFIALARVALEVTQNLDENNPARYGLLTVLNDAFISLETRDPLDCDDFYKSVEPATNVLKAGIEKLGAPMDVVGIIIRLYESQRKRGPVQIHAGFAVESAWETNLLEENESELSMENDSIQLNLRPYQIMTIRLKEKA